MNQGSTPEEVAGAVARERIYQAEHGYQRKHQSPLKYVEVIQFYAEQPDMDDAEAMRAILRIAAVAQCALEDNGVPEHR